MFLCITSKMNKYMENTPTRLISQNPNAEIIDSTKKTIRVGEKIHVSECQTFEGPNR